ncbi:MAG: hypothetical protein JXM79_04725 [Sedimentisphaerales bacterium]|nr:hypothetical protein [Sedimentisphaerales bacterium]
MAKPVLMNSMSYELNVTEDQPWIYARVYDPVTKTLLLDLLADALRRARELGVSRYLIDARGVPSMKTTIEDYDIVNYRLKELGFERRSKAAMIVDPEDKTHNFFEICSMNAGYNWQIFTDADLASQWLNPS